MNEQQVEILKRSVEEWNGWRKENPEAAIDLSGADFSRADLSGADLYKANLAGAALIVTNLSGATLIQADLSGADLYRADLSGTEMLDAKFVGAKCIQADFSEANLSSADFSEADLTKCIGLKLDRNRIRDTKLGLRAKDPWSVLRRTYTLPNLALHLFALLLFFTTNALEVFLGSDAVASGASAESMSMLPMWKLVLGWEEGLFFAVLASLLLLYNLVLLSVTFKIHALCEEERRSRETPKLLDYKSYAWVHRRLGAFLKDAALLALVWQAYDFLKLVVAV